METVTSVLLSSIFIPEIEKWMELAVCYRLQSPFVQYVGSQVVSFLPIRF